MIPTPEERAAMRAENDRWATMDRRHDTLWEYARISRRDRIRLLDAVEELEAKVEEMKVKIEDLNRELDGLAEESMGDDW